jgi:hypothetical protein
MMMDVWSRKIVGFAVHEVESPERASILLRAALANEKIDGRGLVLHADNGGPMKGSTMKATMEKLEVHASYSRPRVSDDNAFSESLFRTLKYRPEYPPGAFASLDAARAWVARFVGWYNEVHLHSAIGFVFPRRRTRCSGARPPAGGARRKRPKPYGSPSAREVNVDTLSIFHESSPDGARHSETTLPGSRLPPNANADRSAHLLGRNQETLLKRFNAIEQGDRSGFNVRILNFDRPEASVTVQGLSRSRPRVRGPLRPRNRCAQPHNFIDATWHD